MADTVLEMVEVASQSDSNSEKSINVSLSSIFDSSDNDDDLAKYQDDDNNMTFKLSRVGAL